jgi:transposase
MERKAYPADVSDDEWAFVAPYLTLMTEDTPQRDHSLREVFNGLRWIVRAGAAWRLMPHDLPPWHTIYPQSQRWLTAGVFETMVPALRAVLRRAAGRAAMAGVAPGGVVPPSRPRFRPNTALRSRQKPCAADSMR